MKPRLDEEKKNRRRSRHHHSPANDIETPKSPLFSSISPDPTKSLSVPNQEIKHSDVIWPFYLCLDNTFAKTFMCCECKQIPKQTHTFTSESGYIFCEYCIDSLIETQNPCKNDNKTIKQKNRAKVIDNLVKSLRIKCPHCKESQLQQLKDLNNIQQSQSSKSHELKMDEIDDIEDDININIPPFPTHINNNMMDEGVDNNDNQIGIVGIGNVKKHDNIHYCDWIGTVGDLHYHLQNDCKFIKINCPLYDLDSNLCEVQNLYQHEMRKHLSNCSVTHWQRIIAEINELKSIQLSMVLKQELYEEHNGDNGEIITPIVTAGNNSNNNNNNKINELEVKITELENNINRKDMLIQLQNQKLNTISKEILHLRELIDNQLNAKQTRYENDITSIFSSNYHSFAYNKINEMQQTLLNTQNKIDTLSNEMKGKDNVISSLQSQIATMNNMNNINNTMKQQQLLQTQPGMVISPSSYSDPMLMSSHTCGRSESAYYNLYQTPQQPPHLTMHSKSLSHIHMNDNNKTYRSDINNNNSNFSDDHKYELNKRKSIDIETNNKKKPKLNIYGVGYNEEGEIGLGHRNNLREFTRLSFCDLYSIIDIYYGSQSFFYVTSTNELYTCGYNKYGQLGLGHTSEYVIKPTLNKYFKNNSNRYIDFISNSVCSYHTILKTSSKLYGYGWNQNGQIGIGKKSFKESVPIELNCEIFYRNNTNIIAISCGFHHTLFLTDGGKVICCGDNTYGQLGFSDSVKEIISPSFIDTDHVRNIINIQCGEYYSCCLDKNGIVLVFGRNDSGQLGINNKLKSIYIPTIIQYFKQNGIIITKIKCGDYHTLCLDSTGLVYAFGNNEYGQIGCNNNNNSFIHTPNLCKIPNNNKSKVIVDIDVGAYHSLLLSEDNQIYSFGNNDCHQCSTILMNKKINSPYWLKKNTEIKCLNENNNLNDNIIQIIAGYDCSFIVTNQE